MRLISVIIFFLYASAAFAQQDTATHTLPKPVEQTPQDKPVETVVPKTDSLKKVTPAVRVTPKTDSVKKITPVKKKFDWHRVYTGGDLGLSFGSITAVNLAPILGYKITPKFSAGIGITYIYYKSSIPNYQYTYSIYGGSLFSRYQILSFLFTHVEYQTLNGPWDNRFNKRYFINNFWVGGGLSQPIGGNSSIGIMILFNLNEDGLVRYPTSPWIRMGVNIGL